MESHEDESHDPHYAKGDRESQDTGERHLVSLWEKIAHEPPKQRHTGREHDGGEQEGHDHLQRDGRTLGPA